jgi:hypothetical protein
MHVSISWTAACLLERRGVSRFSQTTASRKKKSKKTVRRFGNLKKAFTFAPASENKTATRFFTD